MIARYKKLARNLLADVRETDLLKLAVYSACGTVSSTWPSIALKQAGYGTSYAFLVLAMESFLACGLLVFLSTFFKRERLIASIWKFVTWGAAIGWGVLAFTGFDLLNPVMMIVLLISVVLTYMTSVCLFADTLKQVQSGDAGVLKLILFMLVVPLFKILFISSSGYIADFGFEYVALFLFVALLVSNLIWRSHKLLHTIELDTPERIWHLIYRSRRVVLMALSAVFNAVNLPVRFVLVPLYFYEKTGGSLTKVGGVFALLGLVALLAQVAKRYVNGESLNSYNVMIFGLLAYLLVPVIWYVAYDAPLVVVGALMMAEVCSVVWSYGFFIELRKLSEDSPTILNQQWQVMNMLLCGVSCLTLVFVSGNLAAHIQSYLLFFIIVVLGYMSFFHVWWQKKKQA